MNQTMQILEIMRPAQTTNTTQKQHVTHKLGLQARSATLELFADGVTTDLSAAEAVEPSPVFSIVFSTGERVRRCDVFNDLVYDEELIIGSSAIRVARLNSGAPVLDTHEQTNLSNIIGVVVPGSVRIENGFARASIKLDAGPENSSTIRKIRDGIIRNVSVGYVVHRFEVVCEDENSVPLYRATDWEPYEISLVPIGADSGAGIRSSPTNSKATWPCEIIRTNNFNPTKTFMTDTNSQNSNATNTNDTNTNFNFNTITEPMTDNEENIPTSDDAFTTDVVGQTTGTDLEDIHVTSKVPATYTSVDVAQDFVQKDGVKQERTRILEIQKIVRAAKLATSLSQSLIENGTSLTQARKIVLDKLAKESEATQVTPIRIVRDEIDSRRSLVENALLHRHDPKKFKLDPSAREFEGMTLMEIGRDLLERRGVKTRGLSRTDTADLMLGMQTRGGGYMGTTDFAYILSNVANKTMRAAYDEVPQTFKAFTRQTIAPDFKQMSRLQLSDAPALEKVNESGEFKRGYLTESKEQYALVTYGKVISINRQAIINDDLGVFTRLPALFGKSAADLESDTVWNIITANAAMGDGTELFHTKHGNVSGAGSAISIQSLGAAREALRKQKGLNGRFINVTAKYLIVPCALETQAQQFMATGVTFIKSPDVNPFAGTLQVIAEPRLDAQSTTAWYLSGDPAQIDTIEYAYLEGNEGAYLESKVGFETDGIQLKGRLDFAAKAIDWRGLYRNSGSSS